VNRAEQTSAALSLISFENSFIYDERVMHYLQSELEKLLDLSADNKMKQYI
jgi:hypothetical protein